MSHFTQSWLVSGLLLVTTASPARAQLGGADLAEQLVRAHYVEGLPYTKVRELTPTGAGRLVEMLRDPAEAEYHENIVMALGIHGAPQAYPALLEFQNHEVEGEVDAAEYRARRALPLAMGYLARRDPRALVFLLESIGRDASESAPRWNYLYLREQKLAGVLRRAAITGVAISGRSEAVAALHDLAERARLDPSTSDELRNHLRDAQRVCDRVLREDPNQGFGGEAGS